MLLPVSTPPFYGARITPTLFTTVGGLRVNDRMQVMGTDGSPIEGLFAAGGDAAGLYGANYDVDAVSYTHLWFVAICLLFFAFSTILSWNLFAKLNVELSLIHIYRAENGEHQNSQPDSLKPRVHVSPSFAIWDEYTASVRQEESS